MEKYSSKLIGGRRKRGNPFGAASNPFGGAPKKAEVVGSYHNPGVSGPLHLCKDGKCDATGLKMKEFDFGAFNMTCQGDATLQRLCGLSEFLGEVKKGLATALQPLICGIVGKGICEGPSKIASKFAC